jgi:hypothetical protein
LPQKAKPGGFSKPHCGQRGVSFVPQWPQKFMASGLSNPQFGQRMGASSVTSHPEHAHDALRNG